MHRVEPGGQAALVAGIAGAEIVAAQAAGAIPFNRDRVAYQAGLELRRRVLCVGAAEVETALVGEHVAAAAQVVEQPNQPAACIDAEQVDLVSLDAASDQRAVELQRPHSAERANQPPPLPARCVEADEFREHSERVGRAFGPLHAQRSRLFVAPHGATELRAGVGAHRIEQWTMEVEHRCDPALRRDDGTSDSGRPGGCLVHPGQHQSSRQRSEHVWHQVAASARDQQAVAFDERGVQRRVAGLMKPEDAAPAVEQAQRDGFAVFGRGEQHRVCEPRGGLAAEPGPGLQDAWSGPSFKGAPLPTECRKVGGGEGCSHRHRVAHPVWRGNPGPARC